MLTIYGVSIILCFIKILYGSRNFWPDNGGVLHNELQSICGKYPLVVSTQYLLFCSF